MLTVSNALLMSSATNNVPMFMSLFGFGMMFASFHV